MTEIDEDWDVPQVDCYKLDTPAVGPVNTRQASGLAVDIVNCREDETREVVTLMLFRDDATGLLFPMSPETIKHMIEALRAASDSAYGERGTLQ